MPLTEARRVLHLCHVCKYCNGFCEVFRACSQRPALSDDDLMYLAHLCHNCRNCWPACQYGAGHPLAVNVPQALARVRQLSWRNRPSLALWFALLIPLLTLLLVPWPVLFARHIGPGAFYAVLPLPILMSVASLPLLVSLLVLGWKIRRFWRRSGTGSCSWTALRWALMDMASLRNLDGGGIACHGVGDQPWPWRRRFHHCLSYGFLLCLASTSVAAFYHHVLHWQAPYPMLSAPVILGSTGGLGILLGCAGLAWFKYRADPLLDAGERDYSLLLLLFSMSLTGLALLALRETRLMGILLALHLGCVSGFFASLAWGKFAHAPFRAAALLRAAIDRQPDSQISINPQTGRRQWRLQPQPAEPTKPPSQAGPATAVGPKT